MHLSNITRSFDRFGRAFAMFTFVLLFAVATTVHAQQESASKTPDQKQVVLEIYELTKQAKSAKDFTAMLDRCNEALKMKLTTANFDYVTSLSGWAMNRRGELRFQLYQQLKAIGNAQGEEVLEQAFDDFDSSLAADSKRERSWMTRGVAFMELEKYREAALDFTEVVKLKTDGPSGWFNRAEALYQLGKYENAVDDYSVCVRLNANDAQAMTGRGLSYIQMGQFEKAIIDFDKVIELAPNNAACWINRGDAYVGQGEYKAALADFGKAGTLGKSGIAEQRIAWLHATCPNDGFKDASKALASAKRAIELGGETLINLDTLAAAEAFGGNFQAAQATQERVIQLATAEVDVDENESQDANPYQARLALYEDERAFEQTAVNDATADEKAAEEKE